MTESFLMLTDKQKRIKELVKIHVDGLVQFYKQFNDSNLGIVHHFKGAVVTCFVGGVEAMPSFIFDSDTTKTDKLFAFEFMKKLLTEELNKLIESSNKE